MIVYTPLWETMRRRGITTYTLREKYRISGSTVQRLKKNLSVSTNTPVGPVRAAGLPSGGRGPL